MNFERQVCPKVPDRVCDFKKEPFYLKHQEKRTPFPAKPRRFLFYSNAEMGKSTCLLNNGMHLVIICVRLYNIWYNDEKVVPEKVRTSDDMDYTLWMNEMLNGSTFTVLECYSSLTAFLIMEIIV